MKLDRNIEGNSGRGKYALLNLRKLTACMNDGDILGAAARNVTLPPHIETALKTLEREGIVEWGDTPETEFFVIKLKDCFAGPALYAYAKAAVNTHEEFSREVADLADRSGFNHPLCKTPD